MRLKPINVRTTDPKQQRTRYRRKVEAHILPADEICRTLGVDYAGRYPTTSQYGNKYVFILYEHDRNYIIPIPVESRKKEAYVEAFQTAYKKLKGQGINADIV